MTKFLRATLLASAVLFAGEASAATVLITGTNRGIGLEMVKQYAGKGWTVIATARKPADAKELNDIVGRKIATSTIAKTIDVQVGSVQNALTIRYSTPAMKTAGTSG